MPAPHPSRIVLCDVAGVLCDAVTVDALARLQLTARRLGAEVRLRNVNDDLLELISFMGLAGVLGVEARRQAEEREQGLGVEEEGELDDPAA